MDSEFDEPDVQLQEKAQHRILTRVMVLLMSLLGLLAAFELSRELWEVTAECTLSIISPILLFILAVFCFLACLNFLSGTPTFELAHLCGVSTMVWLIVKRIGSGFEGSHALFGFLGGLILVLAVSRSASVPKRE